MLHVISEDVERGPKKVLSSFEMSRAPGLVAFSLVVTAAWEQKLLILPRAENKG